MTATRPPAGRPRPSGARGFTMIEILVVLAVVSIGLAIGLPRVRTISSRQRVDKAAQAVASDVRSAFTSAARGRRPVRVSVPGTAAKYSVVNRVTGDTIVRRNFDMSDVTIVALSGSGMTMDVYPNGIANHSDTIKIATSDYTRRVSVSRVGFVRLIP